MDPVAATQAQEEGEKDRKTERKDRRHRMKWSDGVRGGSVGERELKEKVKNADCVWRPILRSTRVSQAAAGAPSSGVLIYGAELKNSGFICEGSCRVEHRKKK